MATQSEPTIERIREFVLAGHGNLERVQDMLAVTPALLNAAYEWKEDDRETAIQGSAHVGNRAIAKYLLAQGAPLDICTAAMLGWQADVEGFVEADANQLAATGAHGIALLTHAALSGKVALVQWLIERGAQSGMAAALHNAVSQGYVELTNWLLDHGKPDLSWKNFQGKTALAVATERNWDSLAKLLRAHGASA